LTPVCLEFVHSPMAADRVQGFFYYA